MLGLFILMAMSSPPFASAPSFECSPVRFNLSSGAIACHEGFEIKLWGVTYKKNVIAKLSTARLRQVLSSAFRIGDIIVGAGDYVILIEAPVMTCYSANTGKQRTAQCFVKGVGVFGGEDLGCIFIRSKMVIPRGFAKSTYSLCRIGEPKLERGETGNVVEDRT